ncbi:Cyanovirin-N protein [Rutstroemia sp. NJR-2017a WRK4]|nr:Cyanovirin-N protein [Rutstroemia sp. NJR-2017a WRK4]
MSFHASAQDITLQSADRLHLLTANLRKMDGTYSISQLNLDTCIGNNDGNFEWGGERVLKLTRLDFSHSMPLGEVELVFEGDDHQPILHAFLKKMDGERKEARINLAERIGNEDGKFVFSSFHLSAEDIRVDDNHILRARLRNENGEMVDAELDLNTCLGNENGMIQWDGRDFSHSAEAVTFHMEGGANVPVLRTHLKSRDGEDYSRDVNLAERIGNENGRFVFPSELPVEGIRIFVSVSSHPHNTIKSEAHSQVEPLAQQAAPAHPEPPHCPNLFAQAGAGALVGVTTTLELESVTVDPTLDDTDVGVPVGATVPVDVPAPALKFGTDPFHGIH